MDTRNLPLTSDELNALYDLLGEEAIRMDDDGREGAFDASKLASIYTKVLYNIVMEKS